MNPDSEDEDEDDYDVALMIKVLQNEEYILALKTDDKLIFGSKATGKEKSVLVGRIKNERKRAAAKAKKEAEKKA